MGEASSIAELEKMILDKMEIAMHQTRIESLEAMKDHIDEFYSRHGTGRYIRTGKMKNAPQVTPISKGGKTISFDAYLQPQDYIRPNPRFTDRNIARMFDGKVYPNNFTGAEVLGAAEVGAAHIAGKPRFWARSLKDMEESLIKNFSTMK